MPFQAAFSMVSSGDFEPTNSPTAQIQTCYIFNPYALIKTIVVFRLKNIIDRMMPAVLENYSKECQRVAEEK
jgi:hypothetical protein